MTISSVIMVVSVVWTASEIFLSRMKRSGDNAGGRDRSSLRLLWIAIACGLTASILLMRSHVGGCPCDPEVAQWVGLTLIIAGLVLRWVAILTLKQHFTVDVAIGQDHKIIQAGPYRFIRHPAYTGTLVSFVGLGITFMNVLSLLALMLPITAAFLYRVTVEEAALVEAFGDEYRAYSKATRRLLPGVF